MFRGILGAALVMAAGAGTTSTGNHDKRGKLERCKAGPDDPSPTLRDRMTVGEV